MVVSELTVHGTSDEDTPPPYESISHTHRVQHVDFEAWKDINSKVVFCLFSALDGGDMTMPNGCQWEVRLRVKTRDLPRLMVEGFHWTPANFNFNATYYKTHVSDETPEIRKAGWSCSRHFFLSDLGDNPYWAATLVVFSHDTDTLLDFQVTDVIPGNLRWVAAWRDGGPDVVYHWNSQMPQAGMNSVYPNLALKGWWPWPKQADQIPHMGRE